jgi:hypothetical protein
MPATRQIHISVDQGPGLTVGASGIRDPNLLIGEHVAYLIKRNNKYQLDLIKKKGGGG